MKIKHLWILSSSAGPPSSPRIAITDPPSVDGNVLQVCWLQSVDSGGSPDLHYNIYTLEAGDTEYTRVSTVPMIFTDDECWYHLSTTRRQGNFFYQSLQVEVSNIGNFCKCIWLNAMLSWQKHEGSVGLKVMSDITEIEGERVAGTWTSWGRCHSWLYIVHLLCICGTHWQLC